MNKLKLSLGGLASVLVLFFAVNVLSSAALRSMRLDVTEEKLYSLSEGSVNIARSLDEPVQLSFFFSEKLANEAPGLMTYGKRVRELLEEYALRSGGMIELEVVNPEPFSDAEDRAVQAGLAGLPISTAGELLYFGLVGRNAIDGEETIPFFDPSSERFLEYDVTRLIYTLAHPDKNTVGLITSLPMDGGPFNPMNPQASEPAWQILGQLRTFFELEMLDADLDEVPDDVDVLMIVHPKGLPDTTLYAIDQFVLGGGRVMAFVDPHCEADQPPTDPTNPMAAMQADRSSSLQKLFDAWGLEMVPAKVVGDREHALRRPVGGNRPRYVDFVTYLGLTEESFDEEDPVVSQLGQVRMGFAGALKKKAGSTTAFEPLIHTSEDSMQIDQSRVQSMPQPEDLLTSFVPEGEEIALAVRVSGDVSSAFPDGPPEGAGEPDADAGDAESEEDSADEPTHLTESVEPINVVVVSDADMLEDRFWIQEQRLGPILLNHRKTADNGDFVINSIENLLGSNDLISVQAGSRFSRPFDRVERIEAEANERYLAEKERLEGKLSAFDAKLRELMQEQQSNTVILSEEDVAEIEQLQADKVATRKQLRDVQHNLRKDIESLGTRLKVINIFLTPALFIGVVLAVWAARGRQRVRASEGLSPATRPARP